MDIWKCTTNVDRLDFAAAAALLARQANGQSVVTPQPSPGHHDTSADDGSDADSHVDPDSFDGDLSSEGSDTTTSTVPALIEKFLDRLAELLARVKTEPRHKGRQDAKHVSAAVWAGGAKDHPTQVLLTKNEGFDQVDKTFLARLQRWLRAIAVTGPSHGFDWTTTSGQLLSRKHFLEVLATESGCIAGPIFGCLLTLAESYSTQPSIGHLSNVVRIAYILRYHAEPEHKDRKTLRFISLLGHAQAAYETFRTVALSFPKALRNIEMVPEDTPTTIELSPSEKTRLKKKESELRESLYSTNPGKEHQSRPAKLSRLHIHAEMQMLCCLEAHREASLRAHDYIGVSKKTCYLCSQILERFKRFSVHKERVRAWRTRSSHGKVYHDWSLPDGADLTINACIRLAAAVSDTYSQMTERLQRKLSTTPAIAESSAGMTVEPAEATFSLPSRSIQQFRDARRPRNDDSSARDQYPEVVKLGPKITSARACRLPADGTEPVLTSIDFHKHPKIHEPRINEAPGYSIPDFADSWGLHQHDRRHLRIKVENQVQKSLEGEYWIYYNENDELPENEGFKSMLGLDAIPCERRCPYGDLFLVKFEEPAPMEYRVIDCPFDLIGWQTVPVLLRKTLWDDGTLEQELRDDALGASMFEKHAADRALVDARMTPIERRIIEGPGKNAATHILEFLAMTACDDGAIAEVSVERDSGHEGMIGIRTLERRKALDAQWWTGFDSSQL